MAPHAANTIGGVEPCYAQRRRELNARACVQNNNDHYFEARERRRRATTPTAARPVIINVSVPGSGVAVVCARSHPMTSSRRVSGDVSVMLGAPLLFVNASWTWVGVCVIQSP